MIRLQIKKYLQSAGGGFLLDVDLQLEATQLIALFGASGSGKTTLLRCIAGLETPDSGFIEVNHEVWFDSKSEVNLSPQLRNAGYMFQEYALFPNMTVRENLEFALKKGANRQLVSDMVELIGLQELVARRPNALSGGQKQRVALARALVSQPRLLMLDEPLAALDAITRATLQDVLIQLQRDFNLPTMMVSHDISEVYKLAQHVVRLDAGKVVGQGHPLSIFSAQGNSGKFQFTGEVLNIELADVIYILTVLVGNQIVKVVASKDEARQLAVGNQIMLLSKAFNPMIKRVH